MNAPGSVLQRANPPLERFIPNPKLRFMDQCREVVRFKQFSARTEEAYWVWIRQFILFHGKRHPREMGKVPISRDMAVSLRRKA